LAPVQKGSPERCSVAGRRPHETQRRQKHDIFLLRRDVMLMQEEMLTLEQAATRMPVPVSKPTVWRWCTQASTA